MVKNEVMERCNGEQRMKKEGMHSFMGSGSRERKLRLRRMRES